MFDGFNPQTLLATSKVEWQPHIHVDSPAAAYVELLRGNIDPEVQVRLARQALELDPGFIPAHYILACETVDDEEPLFHLRAVELTGEILWIPLIEEFGEEIRWRDFVDTEPYRWSLVHLGDELAKRGDIEGATKAYERVLILSDQDAPNTLEKLRNLMPQTSLRR